MKNNIEILNSIKKVDTPDYLYAKIVHKVSANKINTISIKEMVYLAIPCAALLIIVTLLFTNVPSPKESVDIARGMNLVQNNSLY